MNTITKSIGQCIRKFRQQSDLSQERLAELASCDATYLGEIERGERNASIEVIKRIADALQIPVKYIGVGEQADDLMPFEARDFVEALL